MARLREVALALGVLTLPAAQGLQGEDVPIEFFGGAFLPQSVEAGPGDEIVCIWRSGSHTVTSGRPDGAAGTLEEPGALFDAALDAAHPSFRFSLPGGVEGGVQFFCRNHPGQTGFVALRRDDVTVRVAVVDNAFLPDEVFIFQGDSVRWEHEPNEGRHTVTSGLSSRPEDRPGELFDAPSTDQDPVFVFRFDAAGDVPYFCIPHEALGMKGVVHVQQRFLRGDSTLDGRLDISDPLAILGFLFLGSSSPGCADSQDSNDDGRIDIGDPVFLLGYLFLGAPPPPEPFPLEGPDRTEDGLLCLPAAI